MDTSQQVAALGISQTLGSSLKQLLLFGHSVVAGYLTLQLFMLL
jgi:hypothetical protein